MPRSDIAKLCAFLCLFLLGGHPCFAYLGGFEEQDGYHTTNNLPGYVSEGPLGMIPSLNYLSDAQFHLDNNPGNPFNPYVPQGGWLINFNDFLHGPDVTRYNAGQFGVNAGGPGGVGTDIPDNSGLWQALVGGRLNEDSTAPFWPGDTITGAGRDYGVAWFHPFESHTGEQVLEFLALDTDLSYQYSLDSRDLNGLTPSLSGVHRITMSFWVRPNEQDNTFADNVLGVGWYDTIGQRLIEVGYTGTDSVQYRLGNSSTWQTSAVALGNGDWSNFVVTVDPATDTASLSVYAWDEINGVLGGESVIFTDELLGLSAEGLSSLRWNIKGGEYDVGTGDTNFTNYFDDFSFSATLVPEPGSALLALTGGLLVLRRSRSRRGVSA